MNDCALENDSGTKIQRRAHFAGEREKIQRLKAEVDACTYWPLGKQLSAALDESLHDIDSLEEKLDSKAVIAVIGGTGTGKSSLVNVLCGRENAVKASYERPTTRKAHAIVRSVGDADAIIRNNLDRDDIDIVSVPETLLPNAVLIDSPDTDSNECESYSKVLDKVLDVADVLVCVFEAKNPKRKDNLDRLQHAVNKFQSKHVVMVLNHSDEIVSADDLWKTVVPDFKAHLDAFWSGRSMNIFCTATPPKEHGPAADVYIEQIDKLREFLNSVSGTAFVDERLSRAAFIRENAVNSVRAVVRQQGNWAELDDAIRKFDTKVSRLISDRYDGAGLAAKGSTCTNLLRAVVPQWWGPVGFYLGLSLRFRHFVEVPFSFYDLVPVVGIVRRIKAAFSKDDSGEDVKDSKRVSEKCEISIEGLESKVIPEYAELAEKMVSDFGMDMSLLNYGEALDLSALSVSMGASWRAVYEKEIAQSAKKCCGVLLQLLLNGIFIASTGYVCWILGTAFLATNYLPGEFYRHGASVLFLVWLLVSWIVQIRLNMESRSIPRRTEEKFLNEDHTSQLLAKVSSQVRNLVRLSSAHDHNTGRDCPHS